MISTSGITIFKTKGERNLLIKIETSGRGS